MKSKYFITPEPYCFKYKEGGSKKYLAISHLKYYSKRYNKYITINQNYNSDGATGAWDIVSFAWWVHDKLCEKGKWDDGISITNWQCSTVLFDILTEEGKIFRNHWWKYSTFLFGGGKARKNGMFRIKQGIK